MSLPDPRSFGTVSSIVQSAAEDLSFGSCGLVIAEVKIVRSVVSGFANNACGAQVPASETSCDDR